MALIGLELSGPAASNAGLLDEVIEENLGVHIDGNVEVDFDGFMESLSVLGNLDIELNATEAKYLNAHSDLSETD